MTPFREPTTPDSVRALIDLSVAGDPATLSMADMQLRGIAALYNTLCAQPLAYLADEVGMGKTYQALGLAAVLWNEKPDARILFISPRENLQVKWCNDYRRFFASNYRRDQGLGDDRAASVLFGEPVHQPRFCPNLRSWTPLLGSTEPVAAFLRHTSFSRPVYLTKQHLKDIDALWDHTRAKLHSWSLYETRKPSKLTAENASRQLNLAFARALNAKLSAEASPARPYYDLVVVDEAQCLRNPHNQTNEVLFEALQGNVDKWLLMSATPAHGGPADIPTVVNHYPDHGELIDPQLADDLPALQQALHTFMVRRSRTYATPASSAGVKKDKYRRHERDAWAVRDKDMSTLETLAMGLVQKGLVGVLQGRSNRFRVGFLSSFESLQSSLQRTVHGPDTPDSEEETKGDWHHAQADGVGEAEAPDTAFIQAIAGDFEQRFDLPLPHPKVESVVDRVAPLAFGADEAPGGEKFLIFTRRVSTVETLRKRLTARYIHSIEARVRRCWGQDLDWTGKSVPVDPADDGDDPEAFDEDAQGDAFRDAMARKGWLFQYRQTFRTGRNATFLEDGWLLRLCRAGGVDPRRAAQNLPDKLWAESWTHASRASGSRVRQYRADRLRYLAVHAIARAPETFGLNAASAAPWREAYEVALHNHLEPAEPADEPHRDEALFSEETLWTAWDTRFATTAVALPAAQADSVTRETLLQRQVARTLLAQVFRLTDTVLDLFFAEQRAAATSAKFTDTFLDWASSDDAAAQRLRGDAEDWLTHLRLIVDSSLDGAGRSWSELARKESWDQLHKLTAVLGVTGGSGAHRTATRQFRTPSLPRVIVCTDTLKEGVDLHLFCDRVLHYGVAWTSGDLEQRVGRVDRFFSQIERRLSSAEPPEVALEVGYPHVVASLENAQVDRVIERQRRAEQLMDSPLGGIEHEDRELVLEASRAPDTGPALGPFSSPVFPAASRPLVAVSKDEAAATAEHYARWHGMLVRGLGNKGWVVKPGGARPVREATLVGQGKQHDLIWAFDAGMGRYTLTLSDPPLPSDAQFSGGRRRRTIDRTKRVESFARVLVPTPEEGQDDEGVVQLIELLEGHPPRICSNAKSLWSGAAEAVSDGETEWLSEHKVQLTVARGEREHTVTLYAYEGGTRIVGVVADLDDLMARPEWGGAPTEQGVHAWALDTTDDLPLGYLDVHCRDGLIFGVHVLHGRLSQTARAQLLQQVAWRADQWEASLTGEDQW